VARVLAFLTVGVGLGDRNLMGVVLSGQGLTVWWPAGKPGDGVVRVRGLLCEDHHADAPETLPPTPGVVRRIQVVTHTYELAGCGAWELAPAAPRLRDVERLPTRFASSHGDAHPAETGMLVDFEAPLAP
jgi:hypothetical protein